MIRLVFHETETLGPYQADIEHLVRVCHDRGYEVSMVDVERAWDAYSDSMCAGWLILNSDDDANFKALRRYLRPL